MRQSLWGLHIKVFRQEHLENIIRSLLMEIKLLPGSSGGCFLTDSEEAANKVRKWSTQARENAAWYQHEELGYNYRMSNVVAGVVRGQFPYLNEHIAQKKAIYERYKEGLKKVFRFL